MSSASTLLWASLPLLLGARAPGAVDPGSLASSARVGDAAAVTRHLAQGTPRAWTTLLTKLIRGELLESKYTDEALRIMRNQGYIYNIRKYLEVDMKAQHSPTLSHEGLWVASKTGSFLGYRGEVGVIHLKDGK